MTPPIARPFPRFISDSSKEKRPYGRWEEQLGESFVAACAPLAGEAGAEIDPEGMRFFPERTWGRRIFVPIVGRGAGEGAGVEFYGHVSYERDGDGEPGERTVETDYTDITADDNPDWKMDLNDDVVGQWSADGSRGGDVTLIWGTPLVRGAIAVTAELDGDVIDQAAVNDGRFSLIAVDAVHGFGDDLYLEVVLWDRNLRVIASESLYESGDDEEEEE